MPTERRRWINVFLAGYLGVQLLLPLRGLVFDKLETRANFTWNMYSKRYACDVRYQLIQPDGLRRGIAFKQFFKREKSANKILHRDTLPALHRYLCDHYAERGELYRLEGSVTCMLNGGPRVDLVEPRTDLCSAENLGVI